MRLLHVSFTFLTTFYQMKLKLFFSGCGGQNKTTLSLLSCSFKAFKKIHRIFPISDHSFLPCDRDFSSVKLRKRKVETLYIPNQWISIIDEGSRVHKKFDIVKVTNKDILDFKIISSMFRKVPRCETSICGSRCQRIPIWW